MSAFLSKYGVARHIYIPIVKRAVVDLAVSADWTPAAGDVKISKDGGAAANVTNLPTAITMGNTAMWDFSLTATEMQAAQVMVTVSDSATKAVEDQMFIIETYGNASGQHEFDLDTASVAQTGDNYARLGAPAGASVSADIAGVQTDTNDIQTRLPAALVGGRIDASVGAVAAGAITAAGIAADAIGASELAADAVTEIAAGVWDLARVGHATAGTFGEGVASVQGNVTGSVGSVAGAVGSVTGNVGGNVAGSVGSVTAAVTVGTNNDKTGYALTAGERTSVADALLDRDMSVGTDSGGRTVRNALRFLRNKWSISGTTLTVTKEDDITSAWTSTLGTTAGANPITSNDPA